jgi:phage-related baseplate assembly protein
MQLLDLPAPEVIENFDFESIKARKLARVVELAKAKGIEYVPSESDDLMTMIEASSYEEQLLRTRINNAVKAGLLAFAKGSDLDHLGATRYGVLRLEGAKPYADFIFTLSTALTYDVTLRSGLVLSDTKDATALLLEDVTIAAGSLSANGSVELQENIEQSTLKTETIVTPLPYVATATQNENFHDGADVEDDERYRERIWLSRERKSTAGSKLMYEYFTKSADVRIVDIAIIDDTAGVVKVYLLSVDGAADQVMIDRVKAALDQESVRPLTDSVLVNSATIINATITADIVLYDMTYEQNVRDLIASRIDANTLIFGKALTLPKIYGLLESEMVKDITLTAPTATIACAANEVIDVTTLTLNFTGAV